MKAVAHSDERRLHWAPWIPLLPQERNSSEAAEGFKNPQEIYSQAILADYEATPACTRNEIKKDADAEDNFFVSAAMDEHIALLLPRPFDD